MATQSDSVFYLKITVTDGTRTFDFSAPTHNALPLNQDQLEIAIVLVGRGLYVWDQPNFAWRFVMPVKPVSDAIYFGNTITVYRNLTTPVAVPTGSILFRNGVESSDTEVGVDDSYYAVLGPPQGGGGTGDVQSVNGVGPDSSGNVELTASDIPGIPPAYTLPPATVSTIGGVKPGSGLTVEPDGTLHVTGGAGEVSTVNGIGPDGSGNIELTAGDVGAVAKAGDTMEGVLNMDGNALTNLPDPTNPQDPVTLNYFENTVIDGGTY